MGGFWASGHRPNELPYLASEPLSTRQGCWAPRRSRVALPRACPTRFSNSFCRLGILRSLTVSADGFSAHALRWRRLSGARSQNSSIYIMFGRRLAGLSALLPLDELRPSARQGKKRATPKFQDQGLHELALRLQVSSKSWLNHYGSGTCQSSRPRQ